MLNCSLQLHHASFSIVDSYTGLNCPVGNNARRIMCIRVISSLKRTALGRIQRTAIFHIARSHDITKPSFSVALSE